MSKILDVSVVDSLMVGNNLGMVVIGFDSTKMVTISEMVRHAEAVAYGTESALRACIKL